MDFRFTQEEEGLRARARRLIEEYAPVAAEIDASQDVPWDLVRRVASEGFFRLEVPQEYGGDGINVTGICIVREEFAGVCVNADSLFVTQGLGSYPIVNVGTEEQKRKYLPGIARGDGLAAFVLTEPEAGSDVAGITTTARADGDFYVLNGRKSLITNAGEAMVYTVFANSRPELGRRGISAFIVEGDTAGISAHKTKLMPAHIIGEMEFHDCRVPKGNLLGEEGQGFRIAMENLNVYRTSVGAAACGMARAGLDEAIRFARNRRMFGQTLADFQSIQFRLADMATNLEAARMLVYRAASLRDQGQKDVRLEASMAKVFATEAAHRIIDEAVQIWGGHGMVAGSRVERLYRDVRPLRIYEGASEVQRIVIARSLLGER